MRSELKHESGLKLDMLSPYCFEDQGWNDVLHPNHNEWFQFLAQRAVACGSGYWLRDRQSGEWSRYSNKEAFKAQIYAQYAGVQQWPTGPLVFTMGAVADFLALALPTFEALICAPGAGPMVMFESRKRLNVYRDTRLVGDTDDIPMAEEMLKIIRNSLCAVPEEIGLDAMLAEIQRGETAFAWLMQWLAARYQRPGYTTQTNLWLIGKSRGIGKGSLMGIMRYVMGPGTVQKVVEEEIERGWDDFLFGKQLVEWDEFGGKNYHNYGNYIKLKTGNDTVTLTTRGAGTANHPSIAMHFFSTNNEKPMMVEELDRQNTFIETTSDPQWKSRAKALWNPRDNSLVDLRIASGFAAILNQIEIDYPFIREPFRTELRQVLVATFANSVKQWVEEERDTLVEDWGNRYRKWAEIHSAYSDWTKQHTKARPEDLQSFRKLLGQYWKEATGGDVQEGVGKDAHNWGRGERKSFRGVKLTMPGYVPVAGMDQDF